MNAQLVSILAQIAACNARVEGMKAANTAVIATGGKLPAYGEDHFQSEANTLQWLAECARNLG